MDAKYRDVEHQGGDLANSSVYEMLPNAIVGQTWSNLGAVERLLQSFSQKLSYLNDIKWHEHVEFQRSWSFKMF